MHSPGLLELAVRACRRAGLSLLRTAPFYRSSRLTGALRLRLPRQYFSRQGKLRHRISQMLDEGAGCTALIFLGERPRLFELDLHVQFRQARAAFFPRNEARGQFPLGLVKTSGLRQVPR